MPFCTLCLTIKWFNSAESRRDKGAIVFQMVNIYAHNKPKDPDAMWTELWEKWKTAANLPFPSVVLGDWNFIEDGKGRWSNTTCGIDRLPPL
jgi:hypothetical protein